MILSMVTLPDAEGYATNSVVFRTSAFPPSITLRFPLPVKEIPVNDMQFINGLSNRLAVAGKFTLVKLVHPPKA